MHIFQFQAMTFEKTFIIGNRAALLNLWSEIWLEGSKDLAETGALILLQLFREVDHCRKDVLQLIFTSITEYDEQADVQVRIAGGLIFCYQLINGAASLHHFTFQTFDSSSDFVYFYYCRFHPIRW